MDPQLYRISLEHSLSERRAHLDSLNLLVESSAMTSIDGFTITGELTRQLGGAYIIQEARQAQLRRGHAVSCAHRTARLGRLHRVTAALCNDILVQLCTALHFARAIGRA